MKVSDVGEGRKAEVQQVLQSTSCPDWPTNDSSRLTREDARLEENAAWPFAEVDNFVEV
jgi:hypothetical protein